jgi:hypothetical protein
VVGLCLWRVCRGPSADLLYMYRPSIRVRNMCCLGLACPDLKPLAALSTDQWIHACHMSTCICCDVQRDPCCFVHRPVDRPVLSCGPHAACMPLVHMYVCA